MNHPQVGRLDFEISNFDVSDHSSLKMAVHVPMPGTDTAEKMQALLSAYGNGSGLTPEVQLLNLCR